MLQIYNEIVVISCDIKNKYLNRKIKKNSRIGINEANELDRKYQQIEFCSFLASRLFPRKKEKKKERKKER